MMLRFPAREISLPAASTQALHRCWSAFGKTCPRRWAQAKLRRKYEPLLKKCGGASRIVALSVDRPMGRVGAHENHQSVLCAAADRSFESGLNALRRRHDFQPS